MTIRRKEEGLGWEEEEEEEGGGGGEGCFQTSRKQKLKRNGLYRGIGEFLQAIVRTLLLATREKARPCCWEQ